MTKSSSSHAKAPGKDAVMKIETNSEAKIVISKTAVAHGWGTALYKWVSGLTPDERRAVRAGQTVIVTGCPPAGGNHGSTERRVIYRPGRGYTHRMVR